MGSLQPLLPQDRRGPRCRYRPRRALRRGTRPPPCPRSSFPTSVDDIFNTKRRVGIPMPWDPDTAAGLCCGPTLCGLPLGSTGLAMSLLHHRRGDSGSLPRSPRHRRELLAVAPGTYEHTLSYVQQEAEAVRPICVLQPGDTRADAGTERVRERGLRYPLQETDNGPRDEPHARRAYREGGFGIELLPYKINIKKIKIKKKCSNKSKPL